MSIIIDHLKIAKNGSIHADLCTTIDLSQAKHLVIPFFVDLEHLPDPVAGSLAYVADCQMIYFADDSAWMELAIRPAAPAPSTIIVDSTGDLPDPADTRLGVLAFVSDPNCIYITDGFHWRRIKTK